MNTTTRNGADLVALARQCGATLYGGRSVAMSPEVLTSFAAALASFPQGDRVPVPQNADQAVLMSLLGEQWLRDNAPDRLRATPASTTSEPAPDCCKHGIHLDNACGACVPPRGTSVSQASEPAQVLEAAPSDIDMVHAAFYLHTYRKGTAEGIAFNKGARWALATLAARLSPPAEGGTE